MSEHRATIEWRRETAPFDYPTYNRSHTWSFEGGIRVPASALHAELHERAHAKCFIANSVKSALILEPRID